MHSPYLDGVGRKVSRWLPFCICDLILEYCQVCVQVDTPEQSLSVDGNGNCYASSKLAETVDNPTADALLVQCGSTVMSLGIHEPGTWVVAKTHVLKDGTWLECPSMPTRRNVARHTKIATSSTPTHLYVVGGTGPRRPGNVVDVFDIRQMTWRTFQCQAFSYICGVGAWQSTLYLMGDMARPTPGQKNTGVALVNANGTDVRVLDLHPSSWNGVWDCAVLFADFSFFVLSLDFVTEEHAEKRRCQLEVVNISQMNIHVVDLPDVNRVTCLECTRSGFALD